MLQKIVLFLPKKDNAGGAQFLFLRIAQFLASHPNISISIVDYSDGFIFKNANDFVFEKRIIENDKKIKIYKDEILFTSVVSVKEIECFLEMDDNARLLLWELGPFSFIEFMTLISLYRQLGIEKAYKTSMLIEYKRKKKIKQFLEKAVSLNSIVFMCGKNAFFNKYFFDVSFDAFFVPIAISEKRLPFYPENQSLQNKISICWMSRLVPIKTRPLYYLIDDIAGFIAKKDAINIELLIVGLGSDSDKIKEYCLQKNVPCIMEGRIDGEKLDDFILKNVDLAFSMGTSSLEFAKNKIPSVLTIGGSVFKKDYASEKKYRWLFDTVDYNLSSEPFISGEKNLKNFNEIIDEIMLHRKLLSSKCFNYVQENHFFELVGDKILQSTLRSNLKWKDMVDLKILQITYYDTLLTAILSFKSKFISFIRR